MNDETTRLIQNIRRKRSSLLEDLYFLEEVENVVLQGQHDAEALAELRKSNSENIKNHEIGHAKWVQFAMGQTPKEEVSDDNNHT